MKAFVFKAALYCEDCAQIHMRTHAKPAHVDMGDESSYDSDDWPKGPFDNGGGEADTPQHCEACGVFLENPLTGDGLAYVREKAAPFAKPGWSDSEVADAAEAAGSSVLATWVRFYGEEVI